MRTTLLAAASFEQLQSSSSRRRFLVLRASFYVLYYIPSHHVLLMASNDLSSLSVEELCEYLREKAVHETALAIFEELINGAIFTKLTDEDLKELIPQVGSRLSISIVLRGLKKTSAKTVPNQGVSVMQSLLATKISLITISNLGN
jgi:hypothetical protein